MSSLQPFQYNSQKVRTTLVDGQVWFVASDVAKILGYRYAANLTRRLETEDRGTRSVSTPSGDQMMDVISHTGRIEAAIYRKSENGKQFRKWVTHIVLPVAMQNGVAPAPAPFMAANLSDPMFQRQIIEAAAAALLRADEAEAQLAIVASKVAGYDAYMDSGNTLSLKKAAHLFCNEGFDMGQNKLFEWMRENDWVCLDNSPRQPKINAGFLQAKIYEEPVAYRRNGQPIYAEPQSRVTPKGLDQLRKVLPDSQPKQLTAAPITKARKKQRRSLSEAA